MLARLSIVTGLILMALAGVLRVEPAAADAQHGKYIFQLASCAGCHGPNLGGWKAGGPPEQP